MSTGSNYIWPTMYYEFLFVQKTVIISLNVINQCTLQWRVEAHSVFFQVRTECMNVTRGTARYKQRDIRITVLVSYNIRISGSSVSIMSGYGLNDRAIEVRFPAGAKDFSSSLYVQTGSGAHQPPVQWVPGVLSPGVKRGRGVTLTTHPHLVPRS
jgi:hypothetical protein